MAWYDKNGRKSRGRYALIMYILKQLHADLTNPWGGKEYTYCTSEGDFIFGKADSFEKPIKTKLGFAQLKLECKRITEYFDNTIKVEVIEYKTRTQPLFGGNITRIIIKITMIKEDDERLKGLLALLPC